MQRPAVLTIGSLWCAYNHTFDRATARIAEVQDREFLTWTRRERFCFLTLFTAGYLTAIGEFVVLWIFYVLPVIVRHDLVATTVRI